MDSAWPADPIGATSRVSCTVGAGHAGAHPPLFLEAQVPEIAVNRQWEAYGCSSLQRHGGVVVGAERSGLVMIR